MKIPVGLVLMSAAVLASSGADLPWPRFRGPNGSGVAEGQDPPAEIHPETNLRWKTVVPSGLSSPIVAEDRIVLTVLDARELYVIAYDRGSGRELWRAAAGVKQLEAYHPKEGSPAASTPATDGERVVSYFGSLGLLCHDLDGKLLWRHDLPTAAVPGDFGSGVSPIIAEGLVILVRDELREPKIMALDAATGVLRWQTPRLSQSSYSTPVTWQVDGATEIVAAGHARMHGYDLATGAEKWFVSGIASSSCSSPVTDGSTLYYACGSMAADSEGPQIPPYDSLLKDLDSNGDGMIQREEGQDAFQGFFDNQDPNKDGLITREEWDAVIRFVSEGRNTALALKAGGKGDITETHVLWRANRGLPYIPTAIAYKGQVVMVRDGGIVTAYDCQTGRELFQERLAAPGPYYASPVAAAGRIYMISLSDGTLTVLEAGETPKVLSRTTLGERTAATPAIAHDTLYIRTDRHLHAFENRAG